MSTKEAHVLAFWRAKLKELVKERGKAVTAGELAKHTGQARSTSARYLTRLYEEGRIERILTIFPNCTQGYTYQLEKKS